VNHPVGMQDRWSPWLVMTPKAPATKYLPNSSWLSSATAGLKSVHGPERLLSFKRGPVELEDGLSLVDRTTSRPGSVLVRCLVEPGWLRIPMMLGLWHRLIVDSIELDTALAASSWVMPPEAAILGRSPYNASTNSTCRGPRDPGLGWHGCLSSATAARRICQCMVQSGYSRSLLLKGRKMSSIYPLK